MTLHFYFFQEKLTIDSFPTFQFDYFKSFDIFELQNLKDNFSVSSKYITFFSRPGHNFLLAEVFERESNIDSDFSAISEFGTSNDYLFYFDSSNKLKYVKEIIVSHN